MKLKRLIVLIIIVTSSLLLSSCSIYKNTMSKIVRTKEAYTITFDLDGGTAGARTTQKVHSYYELDIPEPSRMGYVFSGWDKNLKLIRTDTTVKAIWERKSIFYRYTIIDRLDNVATIKDGQMYLPHYKTSENNSFTFGGYSINGKKYGPGVYNCPYSGSIEIVIELQVRIYYVEYHLDGGEYDKLYDDVFHALDSIEFGEAYKEGYKFLGWYTDPEFSQKITSTKGMGSNIDVYARFSNELITITYDCDSDDGIVVESYYVGEDYQILKPTKEGLYFIGWMKEDGKYLKDKSELYDGIKLTAKWTKNLG